MVSLSNTVSVELTILAVPDTGGVSTRAGARNQLDAAGTVISYDQDWVESPNGRAGAGQRAYNWMMQGATEKRKLEALVISKARFKKPAARSSAAGGPRAWLRSRASYSSSKRTRLRCTTPFGTSTGC
ncbi:hypothetical protein AX14_009218 [Amanita brunnescens Koide BX004]|nr:hypothetical protein AX14_009218 [Amanita brunnescens Koide BX004]